MDLIPVRGNVNLAVTQRDATLLPVLLPSNRVRPQAVRGAGGDEDVPFVFHVQHVTFGLCDEALRVTPYDLGQRVGRVGLFVGVVRTQVVARVDASTTSVLFFHLTKQVRGVGDLCLDFLLAVPEVVVSNHRGDDTAFIARAHLECATTVVEFVGILPALPVAALTFRCILPTWQTQFLLGEFGEVGGEDDQARGAGPCVRVEGGVKLGDVGIATIAEDALNKVQVGNQRAGGNKANFHCPFATKTRYLRNDDGAQQKGNPCSHRVFRIGCIGKNLCFLRREKGVFHQSAKYSPGNLDLVVLDRQSPICNVEDALGGAAVIGGVMEDSVKSAVRREKVRLENVTFDRQRQGSR